MTKSPLGIQRSKSLSGGVRKASWRSWTYITGKPIQTKSVTDKWKSTNKASGVRIHILFRIQAKPSKAPMTRQAVAAGAEDWEVTYVWWIWRHRRRVNSKRLSEGWGETFPLPSQKTNFMNILHEQELTEEKGNSKKWFDSRLVYHLNKGRSVWASRTVSNREVAMNCVEEGTVYRLL